MQRIIFEKALKDKYDLNVFGERGLAFGERGLARHRHLSEQRCRTRYEEGVFGD